MSDLLGLYVELHESPVDEAFFYDLRLNSFNDVFYRDPLDGLMKKRPGFYSMKFFGDIYRLGGQISLDYEKGKGVYVIGATNGKNSAIALSCRSYNGEIELDLNAEKVEILQVDPTMKECVLPVQNEGKKVRFAAKEQCIYYVKF
jgi:hypothetical protein